MIHSYFSKMRFPRSRPWDEIWVPVIYPGSAPKRTRKGKRARECKVQQKRFSPPIELWVEVLSKSLSLSHSCTRETWIGWGLCKRDRAPRQVLLSSPSRHRVLEDMRASCAWRVGRTILRNRITEKLGGRHVKPLTRLGEHWQHPWLCLDNQELMSSCIWHDPL